MINRVFKDSRYTTMSNVHLEDVRLSWKAKGLLSYLLTRPDHWQANSRHLAKMSKDGRESTLSGLNELAKFGYAKLVPLQNAESGKFGGKGWDIYEHPQHIEEKPKDGKPDRRQNRTSEKPDIVNTDSKVNTDLSNSLSKENSLENSDLSKTDNKQSNIDGLDCPEEKEKSSAKKEKEVTQEELEQAANDELYSLIAERLDKNFAPSVMKQHEKALEIGRGEDFVQERRKSFVPYKIGKLLEKSPNAIQALKAYKLETPAETFIHYYNSFISKDSTNGNTNSKTSFRTAQEAQRGKVSGANGSSRNFSKYPKRKSRLREDQAGQHEYSEESLW